MSDLQSRITALSPAKRALLERKLREKAGHQDTQPIHPRSGAGKPPLSFSQQRLWFLAQWEQGNPAYNMSNAVRIEGSLDIEALDRTLTEIARRHETLRTTFAADGANSVQILHPPAPVAVRLVDLTALNSEQKEKEISRLINEEAGRAFDLVNGPLFSTTLLQLDRQEYLLLFCIHHIVSDGWSMGLVKQELSTLYKAFVNGDSSPLSELPIQYADFAVWQRQYLQGALLRDQLSYWREQLRDLTTLELPTDHPRPSKQTFNGAIHRIDLPHDLLEGLKSVGRQEGATLFMTLLAAFQTLLHRYSGLDDIVVGTPIAGRTRVEVEALIGFFVNMLVLRGDTSGDPTFREFLRRIEKVALGAYAHQDIPFERLVEELNPQRNPSRNPLFQVVFALQNIPQPSLFLSGLNVTPLNRPRTTIRFDLEVHLHETDDGLNAFFIYNTMLFDSETIARMTGHFRTVLQGIVENPDRRLSQLPLLTTEERDRLVVEWNQTETNYSREACIHELFEAQVEIAPHHVAIEFGAQRLTYQQLNERSNKLAHYLRTLGVGPDVLVGLCMERSAEMIVGFLGILKAGGAYVPLEPSYPPERLALMLADANISVLLTQESLRGKLPETQARVVSLDMKQLERSNRSNPIRVASATNLAYVIYTSGSTGHPKGVCVPHRAVVRLVRDTNYVQLNSADRIAQASNASFDAATFEIWGALLNGASLVGIPKTLLLSPTDFAQTILKQSISTLFLTTSLFNQMAREVPTAFRRLRYLIVGGEACDPKWIRKVLEDGAPQNLLNGYGPTENTTFSTWRCVRQVSEDAVTIPIGRPISNTRVYVLDRYLQPVPVGVIGELYVGGDGLAREYLNHPELTAEKFIPDPFNNAPSSRLYRTGDFVRYLPDGSIDFIGRIDQQVKIRGFRIELREIEAYLSQHPDVTTSVVIARQKDRGDKRLVAYVVPSDGKQPSNEDLRTFLREKLPDYMVPSAFVVLKSLPLTRNGKIDHAALPEPEQVHKEVNPDLARPRTSIEEELRGIWQELLGIDNISIRDNFFDLGGHSLLAIQLIARIEKTFGKTLPVATLFQSPTIEQLAEMLNPEMSPESWSSLIPIQPKGTKLPFFWIHGDSSSPILPAYLGPDQPLYAVEHQGHDGRPARYTQVDTIAKHYLHEVRSVHPRGPYLLGGYSFGALAALEMARQLKREGEEVALLFMLAPPGTKREKQEKGSSPPLWNELQKHLRQLAALGAGERLRYLAVRVKQQIDQNTAGIRKNVRRLRCKHYVASGRHLPVSLRSTYILGVYQQALRSYIPQPYSGRVTLFQSERTTYLPSMNWTKLITGKLEVYEGPGDHIEIRKEPYVAHWAQRLRAALQSVQKL